VNTYAVIMAGGSGKRFWPRSRKKKPKQFLNIIGKRTMLQQTVERIRPLIPRQNIIVVTNKVQAHLVKQQLPWLPVKNIIAEPRSRNTAPCIAVAAKKIAKTDPAAVMVVLPADHVIKDREKFCRTLKKTIEFARDKRMLVTLGIKPDSPHTGYGYIQLGRKLSSGIYQVKRFTEKPDTKAARRYLVSGNYRWNSGMFLWRTDVILAEIEKHLPKLHRLLKKSSLTEIYDRADDISIDYGIMEKTQRAAVREADFCWDDVGSWAALPTHLRADKQGNVIQGKCISRETKGSIIVNESGLTAVMGVEDLIVVVTKDAVLVSSKDKAQQVKKMAEMAEERLQ